MRLRVDAAVLTDAVAWASRTVPARPSVQVLRGLLLEVNGGTLAVSAFDYVVGARAEVQVDAGEDGTALVSGRLLADICKALPAAPVEVTTDSSRAVLECGSARFSLPLLQVEEYPRLPDAPETSGAVDADVLAAAVGAVAGAAGRDDGLPQLTGVRVEALGGRLTLAATDRYRLAVREIAWDPVDPEVDTSALVPARTLADVARASGTAPVQLSLPSSSGGDALVGFDVGGRRTTTRLVEGEFPRYRSLLPTEHAAAAVLDVEPLVAAARRVALVTDRGTPVRCTFDGDGLVLEAGGQDAEAREQVELVSFEGEGLTIAFNPAYLLDGLSGLGAPQVRVTFTTAHRPALLLPHAPDDASGVPDHRYLLMPVRL